MNLLNEKNYLLTIKDIYCLSIILVLYGVVSFYNLGSMENPQTFWYPKTVGERVVLDLGQETELSKIRFYTGPRFGDFNLNISRTNGKFNDLVSVEEKRVFSWEEAALEEATGRFLEIESTSDTVSLGEIGFYDNEGRLVEPLLVTKTKDADKLIDEQRVIPEAISYLNSPIFDEIYHGRTAYEYLHDLEIYEWTHPPLGKLIMTLPIKYMGMTPFAYRFMGNIAGLGMLMVIYIFAKRLFGNTTAAAMAMLLLAFDGMHFVQTRLGTVDSYVVLFVLLAYLFMYQYICCKTEGSLGEKLGNLFASGLFMGMAIATKWNGAYCAFGLAAIFFVDLFIRTRSASIFSSWKKQAFTIILCCFLFFIILPLVVYLTSYIPFFLAYDGDNPLKGLWDLQLRMYNYHSKLDATHSFSSSWYQWPFTIKPVWYYEGKNLAQGMASTIALHSNPIIWWSGLVAMLFVLWKGIVDGDRKFGFLIIAILGVFIPYVFVPRIMYLYHYFPVVPLMILCIVGMLESLDESFRYKVMKGYIIIAAIAFMFFYPIYSGMLVPEKYIWFTQWLPQWHFWNF